MKVRVYPADQGGCGHYRLIWPARALADQGHHVRVDEGLPAIWRDDHNTGQTELIGCANVDADVVVLQRPLQRDVADIIPMLQEQGIAVVVEIDDDFHAIHPKNPAWRTCHPKQSPERNWQHLARACARADLVTVTTPALAARYGGHGRVAIVPNCVPASYLDIDPVDHDRVVGWSGSVVTHPGDLETARGAVGRAANNLDLQVRVVGTGQQVAAGLDLDPGRLVSCGWVRIADYPYQLADLGVGLVPLASSVFNEGKSWLKGLEYAAVGVPFVASPTSPYRQLAAEGAGMLAARPREWETALRLLATNTAARAELREQGRAVAARWTVEGNAWRWMEAWTEAAARRSQMAAA